MKKQQRQQAIIQLLKQNDSVRVSTMSQKFHIVPMTIRRDLAELEKKGILIRTHGGAILKSKQTYDTSTTIYKRLKVNTEIKCQIAKKALTQLNANDHIFIASGSTIELFAEEIPNNIPLEVVTNSINVVLRLSQKKNIKIYLVGGELREKSMSMTGPIAINVLKQLQLNKAFIGINAIDAQGHIYTSSVVETQLLEYLSTSIHPLYVLADASKLDKIDFIKVDLHSPYTLITDSIPVALKANYLEHGIHVL